MLLEFYFFQIFTFKNSFLFYISFTFLDEVTQSHVNKTNEKFNSRKPIRTRTGSELKAARQVEDFAAGLALYYVSFHEETEIRQKIIITLFSAPTEHSLSFSTFFSERILFL